MVEPISSLRNMQQIILGYMVLETSLFELSGWMKKISVQIYIYIWIELTVAIKRMYVNNSNCDS